MQNPGRDALEQQHNADFRGVECEYVEDVAGVVELWQLVFRLAFATYFGAYFLDCDKMVLVDEIDRCSVAFTDSREDK